MGKVSVQQFLIFCFAIVLVLQVLFVYENDIETINPFDIDSFVSKLSFLDNEVVLEQELTAFSEVDFAFMQRYVNTSQDFCIYFEDENGNIIPATSDSLAIGSPNIELEINGEYVPCGKV